MDADFSIELGRDDPVLDLPFKDPAGGCAYVDLKRHPELFVEIQEAVEFPQLGDFLRAINQPGTPFETAKCDAWATTELSVEEDICEASHKLGCYVDIVFSDAKVRSLPLDQALILHEQFARKLVEVLRAIEVPAAAEICVRRCFFESGEREGLYFTLYVSGYGNDGKSAQRNWEMGLEAVAGACKRGLYQGMPSGIP